MPCRRLSTGAWPGFSLTSASPRHGEDAYHRPRHQHGGYEIWRGTRPQVVANIRHYDWATSDFNQVRFSGRNYELPSPDDERNLRSIAEAVGGPGSSCGRRYYLYSDRRSFTASDWSVTERPTCEREHPEANPTVAATGFSTLRRSRCRPRRPRSTIRHCAPQYRGRANQSFVAASLFKTFLNGEGVSSFEGDIQLSEPPGLELHVVFGTATSDQSRRTGTYARGRSIRTEVLF